MKKIKLAKQLWYNLIQRARSTIKIKLIRNLFMSWFNSIDIPSKKNLVKRRNIDSPT